MVLSAELAGLGFALRDVSASDFGDYLDIKKICYEKYVDEYFGGWVNDIQIKMNTDAFNSMMKETCFRKILLDSETAGFFAYDEQDGKIDGVSIEMIEKARNKGMGSFYMRHIIELSEKSGKPVFLKVFKSNPAQNLYKRFGFRVYDETASHFLMRRG